MKSLMTLVIPCYNEENALPLFMEAITPIRQALALGRYDHGISSSDTVASDSSGAMGVIEFTPCETELIFIDDGSDDCTLKQLREYNAIDPSVRYISFSRNFGKEAGIYAGLSEAKGDYAVLLDVDLQHPVECIPAMYRTLITECSVFPDSGHTIKSSLDSVAMYRHDRKSDGPVRSFFSDRFFGIMNRLAGLDLVPGATDFRIMTRKMIDSVLEMNEYNRFSKGIFAWVGYNTRWMPYTDVKRCAGRSKWNKRGLIKYAFEGIFAFSTKPLTISFSIGVILCILALIYAAYTVIKTLIFGDPVAGFPTLFTTILLLGGIQLLFLGILGQYVSRMYLETKHRPKYIEKEKSGEDR